MRDRKRKRVSDDRSNILKGSFLMSPPAHPLDTENLGIWGWMKRRRIELKLWLLNASQHFLFLCFKVSFWWSFMWPITLLLTIVKLYRFCVCVCVCVVVVVVVFVFLPWHKLQHFYFQGHLEISGKQQSLYQKLGRDWDSTLPVLTAKYINICVMILFLELFQFYSYLFPEITLCYHYSSAPIHLEISGKQQRVFTGNLAETEIALCQYFLVHVVFG